MTSSCSRLGTLALLAAALGACDDAGDASSTSSSGATTTSSGSLSSSASGATSSSSGSGGGGGTSVGTPYVYLGSSDGKIRGMQLDPETGALTEDGAATDAQNPSFLAFSPDGAHLYAADEGADEIAAYAIAREARSPR